MVGLMGRSSALALVQIPTVFSTHDDVVAFELGECGAEALVVHAKGATELGAGTRTRCARQGLDDSLGQGWGALGRTPIAGGCIDELETCRSPIGSRAQPYFERLGCRGGAVLGLEEKALVLVAQVQGAVGPGVEVAGTAQGLSGIWEVAFLRM